MKNCQCGRQQGIRPTLANLHSMGNSIAQTQEQLQARVIELEKRIAELDAKVKWYEEQFRLSQQKKFGASSERTPAEQLTFFMNEVEAEADPTHKEPTMETITYRRRKAHRKREALLADLRLSGLNISFLRKSGPVRAAGVRCT